MSVLRRLAAAFGVRVNEKGYKVLDDHVRVIQGDGIDYHTIRTILEAMALDGWSADNLTIGSGGRLLQKVDCDTQRFAFKCSAVRIGDALAGKDAYHVVVVRSTVLPGTTHTHVIPALEARSGRVSTIVWKASNARRYRPSSSSASPITP